MGRNRINSKQKIQKNYMKKAISSKPQKYKSQTESVLRKRSSHTQGELSTLNKKDKNHLHEITKMVNNVIFSNGNIEYEDVRKSIDELNNLKLKTKQVNEIALCNKNKSYLIKIQRIIFTDSEFELETSETLSENDVVNSEIIDNENKFINSTVPPSLEKNPSNKINDLNQQLAVLEESEIQEIVSDYSQETFCSELESRLVISQKINTNITHSKVVYNPEFKEQSHILNNTISVCDDKELYNSNNIISDCKEDSKLINNYNEQIKGNISEKLPTVKVTVRDENITPQTELQANIKTRLIVPNNNVSILKTKNYQNTWTKISNHYSNTNNINKPLKIITKSNNLIPLNTNSNKSTKQKSKTVQAAQTQQFNYSPDESSSYAEQFIYHSKQSKTTLKETHNSEISNDLNTCATFSVVPTTNKTVPVIENTLDNSVEILSHQNINNADDIIPTPINTDKNLVQINENSEITNNTVNTEKTISHEIIIENTVPEEKTEKSIPETENTLSKKNGRSIPESNKNLSEENFQYDKNASVLVNIRKYQDTVVKQLLYLRETRNNSEDRIFTFEQDDKINKNKFKSLFQKRNENNSTLPKTNKNSPKKTNLDYQDVEKFLNHQNRTENLDDNNKIQTLTQMNLKDLTYNWINIKNSEK